MGFRVKRESRNWLILVYHAIFKGYRLNSKFVCPVWDNDVGKDKISYNLAPLITTT